MWFVKSRRAQSTHDYETWVEGGVSPTLNAFDNGNDTRATVIIFENSYRDGARIGKSVCHTLPAKMGTGGLNTPMIAHPEPLKPLAFDGYNQSADDSGIYRTLRIGIDSGDCLAIPIQDGREMNKHQNGLGISEPGAPAYTIDTTGAQAIGTEAIVRRLTPTECERLMGWPDNHTLHRADGKTSSDSTRYKMCGNGVASPVARWIGEQLLPLLGND